MKPSSLCTALLFLLSLTFAIASPAQTVKTFNTLLSFDGSDGENPAYLASLVQGLDGNLYGTTNGGGANSYGTVFKITPAGTLTTLYSFCAQTNCTDGKGPEATLVLATDGNFYGTTILGGSSGCYSADFSCGTVFKMTPSGTLTTLHRFNGNDGGNPSGELVQTANGTFYGTTNEGGSSSNCKNVSGCGTVFKITPAGTLTTLYSFCAQTNCTDGTFPGVLVLATNGNFYGTTGGLTGNCSSGGCGTVFKITPSGMLATLHRFDGTDGNEPVGLVQGTDGNFYGITSGGGASGNGTVFKITPSGTLTTLHSFDVTDGYLPNAILVQGTDGNFYGTTAYGGSSNCSNSCGTVFKITPSGTLTTQHSFDGTDGSNPATGLFQATNGAFYGATSSGGSSSTCSGGCGTVFSLSVGLAPLVKTLPTSGKPGAKVIILGNNLKGATSVTFNGTKATFTILSASNMSTTVPVGSTTGTVKVVTPSGIFSSNVKFQVVPTILSFSPTGGAVGTSVTINGEAFTGATTVAFGGVKGTINSASYTKIMATVPSGAKTGKITVTTPGGTATSSATFTVP